jgi:hypothetical protein
MKRILSLAALTLVTLLGASRAQAAGGPTGVGVIVGDPTGLSLKHWLTKTTAIDAALAWTLDDSNAFAIHADYLRHVPGLVRVGRSEFPFHYGIGGVLVLADSSAFAFRAPVGLSYRFQAEPIDIFAELAGVLLVAPSTDFDINLGIGARYYF